MRSDEIDISHTTIPYAMIFSTVGSPTLSCRTTSLRAGSSLVTSHRDGSFYAGSLYAPSRLTVSSES